VQQHLGRLDGVAQVKVNLDAGLVTIVPKEDGRVDPAEVFKATFDSGVTLAEMKMTARGTLVPDGPKGVRFQITPGQTFAVVPNAAAERLQGSAGPVVLTGVLYRKPKGKEKRKELSEVQMEILNEEKK